MQHGPVYLRKRVHVLSVLALGRFDAIKVRVDSYINPKGDYDTRGRDLPYVTEGRAPPLKIKEGRKKREARVFIKCQNIELLPHMEGQAILSSLVV